MSGFNKPYEQMTDEELDRLCRIRGVPSGVRETFPGRRIIGWLRLDDRDRERWDSLEYDR